MEVKKKKKYDVSFKREAVRVAEESGKPDRHIEKELGIYQGSLRTWRKQLAKDPEHAFPGKGRLKPWEEEMRRLRRDNDRLTQERDILKKAVAIFSENR